MNAPFRLRQVVRAPARQASSGIDGGRGLAVVAASSTEHSVLPELREMWWESGVRARAEAGTWAVFAELPKLLAAPTRLGWRAAKTRPLLVGIVTVGSGVLASFGLLATRQVLVQLFEGGPTPQR